jgi:hypothetical protein
MRRFRERGHGADEPGAKPNHHEAGLGTEMSSVDVPAIKELLGGHFKRRISLLLLVIVIEKPMTMKMILTTTEF